VNAVVEIAQVNTNDPGPGMNLAIFNTEEGETKEHEIEALRTSYQAEKLSQLETKYDQLVYPLIFWNGTGGCGIEEGEQTQGATTLIRRVLIALVLQPRGYFIHQLPNLGEEFICAVSGRLVNIAIKFLAQAERRYFAREDEIRRDLSNEVTKDFGIRSFIPLSLVDSNEYWHKVATKCFAISTQFGPPTFFLTFTMNPHWHDVQALKRNSDVFHDSAMCAIIFKMKLAALMQFIKRKKILGNIKAFLWRIEYQKRGLPHAHMLFWSDFDTQDVQAVESVINVRYPKKSPFFDDQTMISDFRELIDRFQIHNHTKRCETRNGDCRYGFPKKPNQQTTIRGHEYQFARDAEEDIIVSHNLKSLA
jgi:hypothetical protein